MAATPPASRKPVTVNLLGRRLTLMRDDASPPRQYQARRTRWAWLDRVERQAYPRLRGWILFGRWLVAREEVLNGFNLLVRSVGRART